MTLLYFWVGAAVIAQSTQLHFKHFTTDDGLPSSETYVVFEDRDGYIWIGTDNGVARYDGYEFEVFDSNDGLEDVVVFTILEDHTGKIWVGTFSGDAYYFENGRFHSYQYNEAMQAARLGNEFVHLIDVRETGEVVFRLQEKGVILIGEGGVVVSLELSGITDFFYYTPECTGASFGKLAPIRRRFPNESVIAFNYSEVDAQIFFGNGTCLREVANVKLYVSSSSFWPIDFIVSFKENKKIAFFSTRKMILYEEGVALSTTSLEIGAVYYALPESSDALWLGLSDGSGLKYISLDSTNHVEKSDDYLKGRSVSFLAKDRRGGLWVSTTDAGVYYCPFPEQRKYILKKETKSLSVAATAKDNFYVGYEDGTLMHYIGKTRVNQKIEFEYNKRIRHICFFYDTVQSVLYTNQFYFANNGDAESHDIDVDAKMFNDEDFIGLKGAMGINFSNFLGSRKLLAANINQFGVFNLDEKKTEFVSQDKDFFNGIYSFYISPENQYLLGTTNGLKEYDPAHPEVPPKPIDFGVEELNIRITHIKEYQGGLLFATRGEGLVYLKDGKKQVVKEEDGLASDMIRDIEVTADGKIWVATLNGLSKIDFDDEVPVVRTYRTEQGLISNEVYDINIFRGIIWLATSSGIQRFREPPPVEFSPRPIIRQMLVEGDTLMLTEKISIGPGEQNVELFFNTINFAIGNQVNYRYQLEDGGPWRHTNQRKVNFPKLGPGDYLFAVASQNEDKIWSEPAKIAFTIAPHWHQTWWARLLGLLLFTGVISFFFLRRERIRRREQGLLLQINKLEHEALHAQMNPHFVFNALNSIQNFVVHNDAKQAATYLSRFALVVRQTLNSSVKGQQTLAQEINMLETYLSLEKLRFKEAFQYEIALAPGLPLEEIVLPPLLIQPFVENAILHGLKEIDEGGLIRISFSGDVQMLKVEIEDNGIGFEIDQQQEEGSMGMDITRRRLAMMKGASHEKSKMEVEPIYNAAGKMEGTKVVLRIYLEKFLENKE